MRLLDYIPSSGHPKEFNDLFRMMHIEATQQELADGHYDQLELFHLRLNDVNVVTHNNERYICIKAPVDVLADLSADVYTTQEYQEWLGEQASAPSSDALIQALILKHKLPGLHKDFDAFVVWFKEQLGTLKRFDSSNMKVSGDVLTDAQTKVQYDLWSMYRYYLMLDCNMVLGYSPANYITMNDLHISDKGVFWWLEQHNADLMEIAKQHNLLAIYVNFNAKSNSERDFAYYFVSKQGDFVKRPVDESEYMHLAMHGHFPKVSIRDSGKHHDIEIDARHYFPADYLEYNDNAHYVSDYIRRLVRFV